MVLETERMDHSNIVVKGPKYIIVVIYDEDGMYLFQRIYPNKPMYLKYQAPCGKVDPGETGLQAACRELYEKTALSIPHRKIKFVANDPEFNCDIYTTKLRYEIPERTEPENMSSWLYYPWKTVEKIALQNQLTSSLNKYIYEIFAQIVQ